MKKALMCQFPYARGRAYVCKNIGDYVQTVAARQYLDKIDLYIEQEEANNYYPEDKEPAKMIMNGWFQWRAENFPPSEYIKPLLISLHISPLREKQLLTKAGIEFFLKNGPVGCRDYYTVNLLKSKNVPAYFSACLTLTLGKTYKVKKTDRKGYYFVDPYFEVPKQRNLFFVLKNIFYYMGHKNVIEKLAEKSFFRDYLPTGFIDRNRKKYRAYYKAIMFYKIYSKKFSKELLLNASYVTHWLDVDMKKQTNDDLINYAENLISKYSAAKLVVTSRIHAGLPCLGMNTPVIFIANKEVVAENGSFNTSGRLGGLIEFFRCLKLDNKVFSTDDNILNKIRKIDCNTYFSNKDDFKPYAIELEKKCTEFMK